MSAKWEVLGIREIQWRLNRLVQDNRVFKRIMRSALGQGGTVFVRFLRSYIIPRPPKVSGGGRDAKGQFKRKSRRQPSNLASIKRSVGKRFKLQKRDGYFDMIVGFNVGKKRKQADPNKEGKSGPNDAVPHAHFLPLGTDDRWSGFSTMQKGKRGEFVRLDGKQIVYRGRVQKIEFVPQAFAAGNDAARAKITQTIDLKLQQMWN